MDQIKRIIQEEIALFLERELGKSLKSIKGPGRTKIYRAVAEGEQMFKDKDFVTMSLKFAVEHSENNNIYHDETQQVIEAFISNDNVYEAYNPGEYLYSGPELKGKVVYKSKGYDYEGWEELNSADFLKEEVSRDKIDAKLNKSQKGTPVTIVKNGKEQVVFLAGYNQNAFYATTYQPGQKQHRDDSYMRLYPTKHINILKIGHEKVETREDFSDRIEFYKEMEREEKRDMYKQAYAREKADPNIHESFSQKGDVDWMSFFLGVDSGASGGLGFKPNRTFTQRVKEFWVDNLIDAENIKKDSLRAVQDVQARVESMYHAHKEHVDNYIKESEAEGKGEAIIARQLYKLYRNNHKGPINK